MDENLPCMLVGVPSRDPFPVTHYLERHSESSDQHMKKLMSLRAGPSCESVLQSVAFCRFRVVARTSWTHRGENPRRRK